MRCLYFLNGKAVARSDDSVRYGCLAINAAIASICFLTDLWSKRWVMTHHVWGVRYFVSCCLNINLATNSGVAFSWFAHAGQTALCLSLTVALLVTGFILSGWLKIMVSTTSRLNVSQGVASAVLLGGIWGNALDRLRYGVVIDFIEFHWQDFFFPIFNIADIWITLGWMWLLWIGGSGRKMDHDG